MIEKLDALDKQWLLALNNDYPHFWDVVMFTVSEMAVWIPLYLLMLYVIVRHWKKEAWWLILGVVLTIVIADQMASGWLKNWIERPRPTHDLEIGHLVATVNGYLGGRYGFVSSHAANTVGLALLTSLIYRRWQYTIPIFLWSMLNAYSRIYLGVHYVGDVLGGVLVGLFAGWVVYYLLCKISPNVLMRPRPSSVLVAFPIVGLCVILLLIFLWAAVIAFA